MFNLLTPSRPTDLASLVETWTHECDFLCYQRQRWCRTDTGDLFRQRMDDVVDYSVGRCSWIVSAGCPWPQSPWWPMTFDLGSMLRAGWVPLRRSADRWWGSNELMEHDWWTSVMILTCYRMGSGMATNVLPLLKLIGLLCGYSSSLCIFYVVYD